MSWFNKKEKRSTETVDNSVGGGQSLAWLISNKMGAFNMSTWFRCADLIANSIAELPIVTKRINGKGNNILKNHATMQLWNDPNNIWSKYTMLKQIVIDVISKGNAYLYVERAADDTPIALRYLPAGQVTIYYDEKRLTLYYQSGLINGRIMPKDILHFKQWSWDGVKGISLTTYAKGIIELANATNSHATDYFSDNTAQISAVLTSPNVLSAKQRGQILNSWSTTYSNGGKGVTVLGSGLEYHPITNNAQESQLIDAREANAAELCHFLGINPAIIGLKGFNNYGSFEDVQNDFVTRTLAPWILMIEGELTRKLISAKDQGKIKIILDSATLLRPNKQSESQYYQTMVQAGIITINEARQALGYPEVDGGNVNLIPYTDTAQNSIQNNNSNNNNSDGEGNKESQD